MSKRGNVEGAALFATLAPAAQRNNTIRALVAFQATYNYLDALSELPTEDPVASTEMLHQALLMGLHPGVEEIDYYECYGDDDDDGGFLTDLVLVCRGAVGGLPSWGAVGPMAREAAARIVDFQTLNLREQDGGHGALERWALETAGGATGAGMAWWEKAAAAGSSLSVHALIATAARPAVGIDDARRVDEAYWPWGGALHSLLDSLVDRDEDAAGGRACLLEYYTSGAQAALRLGVLGRGAAAAMERLDQSDRHRVILTAMCSYYLSAPESHTNEAVMITRILRGILGGDLSVAIAMFRTKRYLHNLTSRPYT